MKKNKEPRQATALIRRKRNVEEYQQSLKAKQAKPEDFEGTQDEFMTFLALKLKKAEQEIEVLEDRLNPKIV